MNAELKEKIKDYRKHLKKIGMPIEFSILPLILDSEKAVKRAERIIKKYSYLCEEELDLFRNEALREFEKQGFDNMESVKISKSVKENGK